MTRKNIIFILGFIFLLIGTFITIFLISQQQDLRQRASEIVINVVECDAQTIACDQQFQDNKALACANKSLVIDQLISRDDSPCKGRDRTYVEQQVNQACTNGCVQATPTPTTSPTPTLTSTPSPSPTGTSTQPTITSTVSPTPTGGQGAPTGNPTTTATPITVSVPASPSPTSGSITATPTGILATKTPSITPTIVASGDISTTTIIVAGALLFILVGGFLLFAL